MKRVDLTRNFLSISFIWLQRRRQQLSFAIFIFLSFNLAIVPLVYAATDDTLSRPSTWAIGILGAVTLALVIYLFVVVFQPERF
ncbi:K(+)-transporting ATPase subunit F [Nostocaceae cyanobacterium CENA357]|uniref:K(+)-transporting ATPase subunit F n=1 Tax=Atlanticothrix silvestris CENA357 TaxID=1725252 RepID=A0A8J7HFR2_9CYAN|nr:K(+)-transporting ATPase subunit F [Atlanticothrix silvestris]MBH8551721.1 K(+)-transporting ATPase subunit F [Atlanticothrix silvestris CENA357]